MVLVPFRPDYVSQLAVDRVALLIEEKRNIDDLREIELAQRRYVCVANGTRANSRDRNIIDEIGLDHPMLEAQLPHSEAIANAFDWDAAPKSLEAKYGDGTAALKALYDEVVPLMSTRLAAE
jgi:cellulose biosynthesis protein BcsQ